MKKFISNSTFVFLFFISILNCDKNPTSFISPFPAKIAYIPSEIYQIYIMDANGENVQKLTNFEPSPNPSIIPIEIAISLTWSPDRKSIAYSTIKYNPQVSAIYLMNHKRETTKIIEHENQVIFSLKFSPDRSQLVYFVEDYELAISRYRIAVVNIDGSNERYLTSLTSGGKSSAGDPSWSTNSDKILFTYIENNSYHICTVSAVGGPITRLISNDDYAYHARWSPDGKKIVFQSRRDNIARFGIYVMHSDGSHLTRISHGQEPEWSPDGKKIIYADWSDDTYTEQLYVINGDGSGKKQLTKADGGHFDPTWFPNGKNIAYIKNYPQVDIYTMNIETSKENRVTNFTEQLSDVTYEIWPVREWLP
jgi:Tol biopolymer transport system component